ncbi:MAG TPA: hypothetical protein VEL03_17720 [Streptosporangiaceae bacterium]|nr:hypothetical protein [Streptosporangiaceae bacterium]
MIVRILGEGQLHVPESAVGELNELDAQLEAAVERSDEPAFREALDALLGKLREVGEQVEPGTLEPSGLIVPSADTTMEEVRRLLTDEGLIPG